ncbi:MAG TPA: BrnT family toxin [Candidatus Kapabacteria bacterium]|nr:BrnT family toxin [Candidatus Kapabacteria bacterium]
MTLPYEGAEGFEWDRGNILKIWDSHQVHPSECELVFANGPFGGRPDSKHSATEERHFAFGATNEGRLLTVIYTIRGRLLRVVNAWPMSRKERRNYAEAIAFHTRI